MENKTITFTIEATSEELEQIVSGRENPEKLSVEEITCQLCKTAIRSLLSENEKIEVTNQINQAAKVEVKVAEEQIDQKWDGKITVEVV